MKRVLSLACLSLLLGCDDSDGVTPRYWYPLPECPDHQLEPCDTLATECQDRLLSLAACMYDVDAIPRVPIQVVTEEELVEQLDAIAAGDDDEGDAPDADLAYAEQTLIQLQLAKRGDLTGEETTANLVERLEGVYIDPEHGILIVDRGSPRKSTDANAVLLHELVHALQDARYELDDFRSRLPATEDATLAGRTVVEGQATYLHFRALLAMNGRDVERFDWARSLDLYRDEILGVAYEDPSPFLVSGVTFPYAYGVQLAYDAWRSDGPRFHTKQFAKPPVTTLELIEVDASTADVLDADAFSTPEGTLDAGLAAIHDTSLGAFLLDLHLRAGGGAAGAAAELSRAWRGDRLFIYADESDEAAWLWELAFETSSDARAFADRDFAAGVSAGRNGSRVFLAGAADGAPDVLVTAGEAFIDQ